ncbi:MAG TPA: hypothetical protein VMZ53_20180, partial [Kofleriaceae bacterium]|nr:hypothetical protein [Kofleriaceae bacterium]
GMRYALLAALLLACGGSKPPSSDNTPPIGSQGSGAVSDGDCVKTGCSGTICADPGNEVVTTCEMKPEYACYQNATCARQTDGKCGWTQTPELTSCLANPPKLDGGGPAPQ